MSSRSDEVKKIRLNQESSDMSEVMVSLEEASEGSEELISISF